MTVISQEQAATLLQTEDGRAYALVVAVEGEEVLLSGNVTFRVAKDAVGSTKEGSRIYFNTDGTVAETTTATKTATGNKSGSAYSKEAAAAAFALA